MLLQLKSLQEDEILQLRNDTSEAINALCRLHDDSIHQSLVNSVEDDVISLL